MYISIYTCDIHHTVYYMLSILWRLYNTHEIQKVSYVYTKTYTHSHSKFICNSIKLETAHMPFNGQMIKQTVVHPSYEILLSNK